MPDDDNGGSFSENVKKIEHHGERGRSGRAKAGKSRSLLKLVPPLKSRDT